MKKYLFILLLLIPIKVYGLELAKNAKASILIEQSTGSVLYENNADEKLAPASMTKIMTLLLVMEHIDKGAIKLDSVVTISANAASMGGSQVFLEANSNMPVLELLKSIAIASANDSAVALAEAVAGTEEAFVNQMNEKAKSLGCTNTHFVNVHGLDHDDHYTTARDMGIIAKELLKHESILNYTSIYEEYLNKPDGTSTWMVNTNKLIKYYSGLDGLKTGFTNKAGYCLTSTAKRNNMRLISVVMKEENPTLRSNDTIELLNYGFTNYKLKTILDNTKDLGKYEVLNGKKEYVNLKLIDNATNLEQINENKKYTYNIIVDTIKAPVKIGDIVGYVEIISDGKVISKSNITVKENIKKANILDLYIRNMNRILTGK